MIITIEVKSLATAQEIRNLIANRADDVRLTAESDKDSLDHPERLRLSPERKAIYLMLVEERYPEEFAHAYELWQIGKSIDEQITKLLELETAARLLAAAGEYPELDDISVRGEIDYYSEKWNIPTGGENDD